MAATFFGEPGGSITSAPARAPSSAAPAVAARRRNWRRVVMGVDSESCLAARLRRALAGVSRLNDGPHVFQELPGAAVEVVLAAAAAEGRAHLIRDGSAVAAFIQHAEERAVVDETLAHRHGAHRVGLAGKVDERRLVAKPRPAYVVRDRRVDH